MKNTILIFLFQLLFIFSSKAQELKIGFDYKPGFSVQKTNWYQVAEETHNRCRFLCSPILYQSEYDFVNSFNFNINYVLNDFFSIESGVGLINRNQKIKDIDLQKTGLFVISKHYYISAPIIGNFHYKNFYLGAGVSINSYFISKSS